MNKRIFLPILLLLAFSLTACGANQPENASFEGLVVSVSVLPEKYFVDRIGGEFVQVNVMVGPGDSPHSYEPKSSQMAALSNSDVYFRIGVEFEDAWMNRIASANPNMQIIDLTQGILRIPAEQHLDAGESAHDDGDELDPHIWTSPANGIVIAESITDTLVSLDPLHADIFKSNLEDLRGDIHTLQADISAAFENLESRKFMVFHPAWGYFAGEFGLEQIPIEVAGSEPSLREQTDLIERAKKENITVIFAQPEFSTRSADYIASEIAGKVILVSPLAEDWLGNLRRVADIIAEEL